MTTALRIREVADASGFTTATLRYYEQIGLLPEASRSPAGYRLYDEHALDRLAFIARAKQLGCTLAEITGLTAAWDGGRCGPVQDQLRRLVADKVDAAERQIAELLTFTAELQRAAATLERHRPDGACDAGCGCIGDPQHATSAPATERGVSLSPKPAQPGAPAIACTLSAESMKGRITAWRSVLGHVAQRERIDGGVRCVFACSAPIDELTRVVTAEQECCPFFRFAITVDTRGLALEIRAPDDAQPIVDSMFGVPS